MNASENPISISLPTDHLLYNPPPIVLIDAPEFQLREYSWGLDIKWSQSVLDAHVKSLGRFQRDSKSNSTEDKVALFWALHALSENAKREGSSSFRTKLSRTLGRKLLEIENATTEREADDRCSEAISLCTSALKGFTAWKRKRPDGRSKSPTPTPTEISVFEEAEFFIKATRRLPDKATIRMMVEAKGEEFTGKNIKSDWERVFNNIGLGGLPEFIPPSL